MASGGEEDFGIDDALEQAVIPGKGRIRFTYAGDVFHPVDIIEREDPGRVWLHFWLSIVSGRILGLAEVTGFLTFTRHGPDVLGGEIPTCLLENGKGAVKGRD